ncbi:MAG: ComF family protein [Parvularculaceae bacterium]|nr:ComF family protein [Parvularculaceae bacterium]
MPDERGVETVPRRERALLSRARSAGRAALDLLLPPACPISGERVATPGLLSASGWSRLQFIDDPVCAQCGAPFGAHEGDGALCPQCIAEPPSFDRARAAVVYGEASHRLIVAFKHADRTELLPLLAGLLARAAAALGPGDGWRAALIVPCPLHPLRLLQRRYNQAAMLALALKAPLGGSTGPEIAVEALRRVKPTRPQQRLSAAARQRNVAGAFAVNEAVAARIEGRRVILVDDVLTTGATLSACARALKKAGASRVEALVVARALSDGISSLGS